MSQACSQAIPHFNVTHKLKTPDGLVSAIWAAAAPHCEPSLQELAMYLHWAVMIRSIRSGYYFVYVQLHTCTMRVYHRVGRFYK